MEMSGGANRKVYYKKEANSQRQKHGYKKGREFTHFLSLPLQGDTMKLAFEKFKNIVLS